MKLFPSLTLATLCIAFAGCSATTQTISFIPANVEQNGVIVSIDGQTIGEAPVDYTATRTETPTVHKVVFSKDGYIPADLLVESWIDTDGLCSFLDDYPVPTLQRDKTVVKVVPPSKEVAPEPMETNKSVPAVPVVKKPVEVKVAEVKPVVVVAPATTKVAIPEPPAATESKPTLDPNRTLKDIQEELKTLSEQRQNGRLSEQEFQKACADLEREVRTRYGK